jgi:cytochrome c oxidase subunit 2
MRLLHEEGDYFMKKFGYVTMLIALLFILSACGSSTEQPANSSAPVSGNEIVINAKNFEFDSKEYRVKQGEPVTITLKNTSGIHGIAITELDVQLDSNKKSVTITPDQAGEYEIVCSIMCGSGHAEMKSVLIVE